LSRACRRSSFGNVARRPRLRPLAESQTILDASALLAYLQQEPGFEYVQAALASGARISTVNLAEVLAKVVAGGVAIDAVIVRLAALGLTSEPFTDEDARASATICPITRGSGLSLGDRACLALGLRLAVPVLTGDRSWAQVPVGVEVRPIR
jgi:PIN domain nuclease of toxin-antitoxin system